MSHDHVQEFWLELLGISDASLAFIEKFMSRRSRGAWERELEGGKGGGETVGLSGDAVTGLTGRSEQDEQALEPTHSTQQQQLKSKNQKKSAKKPSKKKKLVKIGSHEDMDGRAQCECMATVHSLYTNCLYCGKIICEFEQVQDAAHCPYCATDLVSTDIAQDAIARKDTLLEYDRNSSQRTRVIDVATDFDQAQLYNKWKSAEERALLLKQIQQKEKAEEERKRARVLVLDLENKRAVIQQPPAVEIPLETTEKAPEPTRDANSTGAYRNPAISRGALVFLPTGKSRKAFNTKLASM
jgi:hypothetical protein